MALTRFYLDTEWNGEDMLLQSRAMDETGYVQPTKAQLRDVRGYNSIYHNNCIPDVARKAQRGGRKCRKSLNLFGGTALGTIAVLTMAVNFADRNVAGFPENPAVMTAIAAPVVSSGMVSAANASTGASEGRYGLGRPALPEEVAAWGSGCQSGWNWPACWGPVQSKMAR